MTRRIFPAPDVGFEIDPVEGNKVGRDPRKMTAAELAAAGHEPSPILKLVREKCLDCCGYQPSEVRRCTAVGCSLWPLRMSFNPFRTRARSEGALDAEKLPPEGPLDGSDYLQASEIKA